MTEIFNVFIEGTFVGTATTLVEATNVARMAANRLGKLGSVKFLITDNKNNRRQGGSLYIT